MLWLYWVLFFIALFCAWGKLKESYKEKDYKKTVLYVVGLIVVFLIGTFIRVGYINERKAEIRKEAMETSLIGSKSAVDNELEIAEAAYNAGDYKKAEECASRIIKNNPQCAQAYVIRGDSKMLDFSQQISDYTAALEIDSKYVDAYLRRAETYNLKAMSPNNNSKTQDLSLAIADFTKVIDLAHGEVKAYIGRGEAYRMLSDFPNAISDFTKAIELDSKSQIAYENRAHAYQRTGNHPLAIADYTKAIELLSNLPSNKVGRDFSISECYCKRGYSYKKIGDISQSISDYTKAVESCPNNSNAYFCRAGAYLFDNHDCQKAINDATKAIELRPKFANAYVVRGTAYDFLGNKAQAEVDYKMAESLGFKLSK